MNSLYVFGCSISNNRQPTKENLDYVKYKGYEIKTWSDILAQKLSLNLENYAISGASNQTIFEEYSKNCDKLKKDDLVIINWTDPTRFRVAYNHSWVNLLAADIINEETELIKNQISKNTISEILINRTHYLYNYELDNWYNLIKLVCDLKNCKLLFWSYFTFDSFYTIKRNNKNLYHSIQSDGGTITSETFGIVNDDHYSEKSHHLLGEFFYEHISNTK